MSGLSLGECVEFEIRSFNRVYRAMHVVLARYCYRKSSVRLSLCLSVCDVDVSWAYSIGWTSSKLITQIISIMSSLLGATTSALT